MSSDRVVVASDHGGYPLKEAIKRYLQTKNVNVLDVGTSSTEACDYPVFAKAAAQLVASKQATLGIVVDGAGIGSCMVANKVPGVRAGMAFDVATAKNAREHNDANLLTLVAGSVSEALAFQIVETFLNTQCTVDRHRRRVAMINALDDGRSLDARNKTPMTIPQSEFESLVSKITKILSDNPALMQQAGLAATQPVGASCDNCNGCGHCVSRRPERVREVLGDARGARVSTSVGVGTVPSDITKFIDHTLLKPDATYSEVDRLCDEAAKYGFASVCVNPVHVKRCAQRLQGASSVVCTVIGFPLGATPKEIKALEARRAIRDGAREVDMVINIGALKSGDHKTVYEDIRMVVDAARDGGALIKVIIETALLTDEEKVAACVLSKKAHADFVKTSTGFAKGGATEHDVALMAQAVEHKLGVKASGGVKSADDAQKMIKAGATRIGASVGVKIAQEMQGKPVSPTTSGGAY